MSDIAGKVPALDPAVAGGVALVLIAGDITLGAKHEKSIAKAFTSLGGLFPPPLPVYHVPGNHDYPVVAGAGPWLPTNFIPAHGKVHRCTLPAFPRPVVIVGFGGARTGMYNKFAFDDDVIDYRLRALCEEARVAGAFDASVAFTILLLHDVPAGTSLDVATNAGHVGSPAIRAIIESFQPDLVVGGHIHESAGVHQLGRSTCINAGEAKQGHHAIVSVAERGAVSVALQ